MVPWEHLNAGNPASGVEQEEQGGTSSGRDAREEEALGNLMNEDSSIAVAAKVCVRVFVCLGR